MACRAKAAFLVMAALLNGHRHYLARALRAAIVPFFAARMLSIKPRTALMNIVVRIGVRGQSSIGLPVQGSQRTGLATRPRTRHHRVGCPSEGRPARQCLPGTFMLGYTGLNCQQSKIQGKVEAMQSSSISAGFEAKAFSRSVASRTGLTVGSTRTPILRIAPDRPYGRRLTWR